MLDKGQEAWVLKKEEGKADKKPYTALRTIQSSSPTAIDAHDVCRYKKKLFSGIPTATATTATTTSTTRKRKSSAKASELAPESSFSFDTTNLSSASPFLAWLISCPRLLYRRIAALAQPSGLISETLLRFSNTIPPRSSLLGKTISEHLAALPCGFSVTDWCEEAYEFQCWSQ
ncbi:hypothetical protein GGTG_09271 [Gaeumannomyces tritici R3-111a-1]|uniref:Uncharacterized protein n=1 Tax=Gaeumannomyces tritici (strain R3-111a-1) TaxID=644352 RepID=J3P6X5_GAET3|nr:hypothetical protein GGTG_09271 [Gaeumannomyces tritici R3-111a-1]EJT72405.1 hypothetical protein GGTG_09271 [Gaeumannomyces tritici R3-111a-1]